MSIYLGSTPIANTGYDKANTDLSNLTATGKNIANWSSNVTNCITEIPQDIKLELNNGTLTLKAGSKVYVPNGFESDVTTPKFDAIMIESDRTITRNIDGSYFVTANNSGALNITVAGNVSSGTNPTPTTYNLQYNTTDNKIRRYYGSTDSYTEDSFPVAKVTVSNSAISSIDQVFNGFGYIGSTVFALPGVKGLISNGRNDDGSLKNIELTVSNVLTNTYTGSWANTWVLQLSSAGMGIVSASNYIESDNEPTNTSGWTVWHNTKDNINYLKNIGAEGAIWERQDFCNNVAKFITDSSNKITSLTPKTAFHALDYNDSSTISGWSMPSSRYIDLTLLASGSAYTAPANGWVCLRTNARSNSTAAFSTLGTSTTALAWEVSSSANIAVNWDASVMLPVKKGQKFWVIYGTTDPSYTLFRFIYAEGENV